jgi:glycosyltransferase involved in cell wall biosynthesis
MKAIIVIPAYNEELNLLDVVRDIRINCPGIDYVIVNDGSTDGTTALCEKEKLNYISLVSNLGFSGAVQTGYKYVLERGYGIAVQFDGDGQHPAAMIREMVEMIARGEADYVLGSRYLNKGKGFSFRRIGSHILSVLIWLRTGKLIFDPTSGMRAINRAVISDMARRFNFIAEPDTLTRALLNGRRVKEIQVEMRPRLHGESHFKNPLNGLQYMLRMTVSILLFQGRDW